MKTIMKFVTVPMMTDRNRSLYKNAVLRKKLASCRRLGPLVKATALLLISSGLVNCSSYGQGIQGQAQTLASSGGNPDPAIAAIAEQLRYPDANVRLGAVAALRAMGNKIAIPPLAEAIRDSDAYVASDASGALAKVGRDAVPSLVPLLRDSDPRVRHLAARTLQQIGPEADAAVPALTQLLRDWVPAVRQSAVVALQKIGPNAKTAIPALAERLGDTDAFVASDASTALSEMGPDTVPSLVPLLSDPEPRVRALAARTLRQIGPAASAAVPALTARLRDWDPTVRQSAVFALQGMGDKAKSALPALAKLLRDQIVGIDASEALVRLGQDAVPHITGQLRDADAQARVLALETLRRIATEDVFGGNAEHK